MRHSWRNMWAGCIWISHWTKQVEVLRLWPPSYLDGNLDYLNAFPLLRLIYEIVSIQSNTLSKYFFYPLLLGLIKPGDSCRRILNRVLPPAESLLPSFRLTSLLDLIDLPSSSATTPSETRWVVFDFCLRWTMEGSWELNVVLGFAWAAAVTFLSQLRAA